MQCHFEFLLSCSSFPFFHSPKIHMVFKIHNRRLLWRDTDSETSSCKRLVWDRASGSERKRMRAQNVLTLIVIFSEIICLMSTNSWKIHQRWFCTRSKRTVCCRPLKKWMRASQEHDRHTQKKIWTKRTLCAQRKTSTKQHKDKKMRKKPPALNSYPFIKFKFKFNFYFFFSRHRRRCCFVLSVSLCVCEMQPRERVKHCKSVKICLFLFVRNGKFRLKKYLCLFGKVGAAKNGRKY